MMSTVYKFLDAMTRSIAAYRMTQLGYHDEAKRLMCNDS